MSSSAGSWLCTVVAVPLKIACPASICLRSQVKTIAVADLFRNFFRRTSVERLLATFPYRESRQNNGGRRDAHGASKRRQAVIELGFNCSRRSYARSRFFRRHSADDCGWGGRIRTSEPDHHRLRLELHAPYLFHSQLDLIFQGKHLSGRGSASIDDCEGVFV
jgi:hypothetical protein